LLAHDLRLAAESLDAGEFAEAARAAVEDVGRTCFGQEEGEKDEGEAAEPHQFPDRPRPAFMLSGESADEGTKHGSTYGCDAPDSDGVGALVGSEHIADTGASGSEDGTADEAG